MGKATATAKVILLGEHFVVHGSAGLAVPFPALGMRAAVWPDPDDGPVGHPAHVRHCLAACREVLGGPPPEALLVTLDSDIPQGVGLGSSAALAVAIARAYAGVIGHPQTDLAALREVAARSEAFAHGRASGIDAEVILQNRALSFRRGAPPRPATIGPDVALALLDAEEPARTADMVAAVAGLRERDTRRFDALVGAADRLVAAAEQALAYGEVADLGRLMNENHALLQAIGVSTAALDRVVGLAREAGAAGAKLTGGGGGGVVAAVIAGARLGSLVDELSAAHVTVLGAAVLPETEDFGVL